MPLLPPSDFPPIGRAVESVVLLHAATDAAAATAMASDVNSGPRREGEGEVLILVACPQEASTSSLIPIPIFQAMGK